MEDGAINFAAFFPPLALPSVAFPSDAAAADDDAGVSSSRGFDLDLGGGESGNRRPVPLNVDCSGSCGTRCPGPLNGVILVLRSPLLGLGA